MNVLSPFTAQLIRKFIFRMFTSIDFDRHSTLVAHPAFAACDQIADHESVPPGIARAKYADALIHRLLVRTFLRSG